MKHLTHKLMKGMKELSRLMFPLKEQSVCRLMQCRDHIFLSLFIQIKLIIWSTSISSASCCNSWLFSALQADLLGLPLSGQQHQGPRLRLLLPPHTGHAGGQPVLRLLVSRTRGHFRRGTSHDSSSSQAALVGLKGGVRKGGEEWRDEQL